MPLDIQINALQTVPALADVQIYRPGYAIEYDFFDPTQLHHTLETKLVKGLYFAGEILDVDGPCGGYNLLWAWSSGRLCGESVIAGDNK